MEEEQHALCLLPPVGDWVGKPRPLHLPEKHEGLWKYETWWMMGKNHTGTNQCVMGHIGFFYLLALIPSKDT